MAAATKLCLVVVLVLACAPAAADAGAPAGELAYVRELNRVRSLHGLTALRVDPVLAGAARSHSLDMLRRRYFAHGAVRARLARFGADAAVMGENLAWGVAEVAGARRIVALWLSSPGHRRNVLHPAFRRVGVGVASGRFAGWDGVLMITAEFASTP